MTLREYLSRWGPSGGRYVGKRWRRSRLGLLRRHVLSICGELHLEQITPAHLWAVQRTMLDSGKTSATVNRTLKGALAAMLRDAGDEELCPRSTNERLLRRVPKLRENPKHTHTPHTRENRDKLLAELRRDPHPPHAAFAQWLFASGMRPGEALAITWDDVDPLRHYCRIAHSREGNEMTDGKTRHSVREISLTMLAIGALARVERASDLVFVGIRGAPLDRHNYAARIWRPAERKAGVPVLRLYAARSSFISYQLEAGKSPAEVARYCGTSPAVIWKHYWQYTRNFRDERWDDGL